MENIAQIELKSILAIGVPANWDSGDGSYIFLYISWYPHWSHQAIELVPRFDFLLRSRSVFGAVNFDGKSILTNFFFFSMGLFPFILTAGPLQRRKVFAINVFLVYGLKYENLLKPWQGSQGT